tara:strand:+ start:3667 stop:4941 length:1275 start_codon:yes stop_codon:yes gene_type:complete
MSEISNIIGREIIDSRGNPTLEVDVFLDDGAFGRASVPSGASTGAYEVIEKRDNTDRFKGMGVKNAADIVNSIIFDSLKGQNCLDQQKIDKILIELDGTHNKSVLGGNSILGVSLACCRAASESKNLSLYEYIGRSKGCLLPIPFMNIINGGVHANNKLDFQELMIVPYGFSTFSDALRCGSEIFHSLKDILSKRSFSIAVGDEGGFAPNFSNLEEALDCIISAINDSGYTPGKNVSLALDVASTEFYSKNKYYLKGENKILDGDEMIKFLENLCSEYPIISIEDGMAEDDWDGWRNLTSSLGKKIQLVGDDLFVTNPERLRQGIDQKVANSILIKYNQIGTLTETIEAINIAKNALYGTVISHRSGETEDTFIADLAVAIDAGQIKTGSMSRSDRLSKYNQLLRIEERLSDKAQFNRDKIFYR